MQAYRLSWAGMDLSISKRPTLVHSSLLGLARMLLASSIALVDICICTEELLEHTLLSMITMSELRTYPELNKFVLDLDEGMPCVTYTVEYCCSCSFSELLCPIYVRSLSFALYHLHLHLHYIFMGKRKKCYRP